MSLDSNKRWKKLSEKVLLENKWINVVEDEVQTPSGHRTKYIRLVNTKDAVTVIAINNQDEVLLQRQYSYPLDKVILEMPGGGVDGNETLESAAARELAEETGYSAKQFKHLGSYYMANRRHNAKMHVFLAKDLSKGKSSLDETEDIEVQWHKVSDIDRMILSGEIENGSLVAAWAYFRVHMRS